MTDDGGIIAYLSQATKDAPLFLCVMDRDKQQYHMFPFSLGNAARLAYECSGVVNTALGAVSDKFATQEIVARLSAEWGKR